MVEDILFYIGCGILNIFYFIHVIFLLYNDSFENNKKLGKDDYELFQNSEDDEEDSEEIKENDNEQNDEALSDFIVNDENVEEDEEEDDDDDYLEFEETLGDDEE